LAEHNIARIENGRWNPPAEVKARLAEILRKSTFEVFQ
jgi:DNA-binding XRE family transcriptional regulator